MRTGRHSRKACMMASISRSWVGYFRSGEENIFDVKATGNHLPFCSCSSKAPEATPEASENILRGSVELGRVRTGLEVSNRLSSSKACCRAGVHSKGTEPVSSESGAMIVE